MCDSSHRSIWTTQCPGRGREKYPQLSYDSDLNNYNDGITIVPMYLEDSIMSKHVVLMKFTEGLGSALAPYLKQQLSALLPAPDVMRLITDL